MFVISDLEFEIEFARLDAFVDQQKMKLVWGIEVQARSGEGKYVRWVPKIVAETLFESREGEMMQWWDLAGFSKTWSEPVGPDGEPQATLYVFSHQPIYDSRIEVKKMDKGLGLGWEARADVNWDEKYSQHLELIVETRLQFTGVWFGRQPEAACQPVLARFFDPSDFVFCQTEHGVSIFRPRI